MAHRATDEEAGDSAEAQRIVESEYGARKPHSRWQRWLLVLIAVSWSLFQLYATYFGSLSPQKLGAIHLAFGFALAFLSYPGKRGPNERIPWYDWLLAGVGMVTALYIVVNYYNLVAVQGGLPITRDVWMGSLLLITLGLAASRIIGIALPIIASIVILYGITGPAGIIPLTPPDMLFLHNGYDWRQIVQQLYITTEGIWGTPIQVSASFVFLFVLFGALLDRAGAGQYFVDLAYSGLGTYRGGPAKAAVVASLLTGIVSGSSTANTVTTGTFTIPLMKKIGYPPLKAGAIECAASTNGQLMPPIMGAAAFIMATFLNIPYSELILYALVPALLSYMGLVFTVHLEALKLNLPGMPRAELPPFWPTFLKGVHYLVPVAFLLYELMWVQLTPERSALNALVLLIIVMFIQEAWLGLRHAGSAKGVVMGLWQGARLVFEGLEKGARNMTTIAIATAAAGIIVGMVTMTNLGYGLTQIIGVLSMGNIWLVLILAALTSLILGIGLPTTANYIVMAALVAPVIANLASDVGLDVPLVAIHLFVFYFGILADDTPPVGLAAYAASAISRADPVRTGVQGFIYDLRTVILPFMFFFNPELILHVDSWLRGGWVIFTAVIGMLAFVAATQGYLVTRMRWYERLLVLACALAMIKPGLVTDLVGLPLLALVFVYHRHRSMAGGGPSSLFGRGSYPAEQRAASRGDGV
ncbi:TRAP transporter permease [Vreelandella subglaciescola]|jgi:TRAP transporter 4TM/12TM fusion protein|uniref:TRAP transporter, 4TM/12TM fusion protein n=1 Tax=Vreelandella subglaciescola TaxID=29571 RepID=A0A1M7GAI8_9GAMM|nr:TRAP transporter permease [Halomonas subglaciescola]SHM13402.1 TRAP transporter, 4TM/12TM fusion protein [Halomonas subglaciescola]